MLVSAQEFPQPTPAGNKALVELFKHCVESGGLKLVGDPRTKKVALAPGDPAKLKATMTAQRQQLTPVLRDTLLVYWSRVSSSEADAVTALLRAVAEETQDEEALAFAMFFTAVGQRLRGDDVAARQHYQKAARHFERVNHLAWQATCLNNIGSIAHSREEYAQALQLHQQALALRRKVLGEAHPHVATSLNNIGLVHDALRDYHQALSCYQQALAICRNAGGDQRRNIALTLHNLGGVYRDQGDYRQALRHQQEAVALYQTMRGNERELASSLEAIGTTYRHRGDYSQALKHHLQALTIYRAVHGGLHPDLASNLNSIGLVHDELGNFSRALECYRQALAISSKLQGPAHFHNANYLINIGTVHLAQEDFALALTHFQQALAIARKAQGEQHPTVAGVLSNIGAVYQDQRDFTQAFAYYQRALDIAKKVHGEQHPEVATNLNNLGLVYHGQRDYRQAVESYRQALWIRRQVLGERHPLIATTLNNLGAVYLDQGKDEQALAALTAAVLALRIPERSNVAVEELRPQDLSCLPGTVQCLHHRAWVLEQCLGPAASVSGLRSCAAAYTLAAEVMDRLRGELGMESDKLFHGGTRSSLVAHRVRLAVRLFAQSRQRPDLETAFLAVEQGRARVFLEMLGRSRAQMLGGIPDDLRERELELRARLRRLDERLGQEQDQPLALRNRQRISQLLDERGQAETVLVEFIAQLERFYPQYAALKYPRPCSLAEARACLQPNEVALLFVLDAQESLVVLVEPQPGPHDKSNGLAVYRLPRAEEIVATVDALTNLETLSLPAKAHSLGAEAYAQLLGPLADRIRGRDLLIVPDPGLGHLPFELLVEGATASQPGEFLVEKHRIRYAYSLSVLHMNRRWQATRQHPEQSLWAMGDPIYAATDPRVQGHADLAQASKAALAEYVQRMRGGGPRNYARLPFSGHELLVIRSIVGAAQSETVTGLQASEAVVKSASRQGKLAQARYIHFATHGILGLDMGRQPSLVLSLVGNDGSPDDSGGTNDGFLQLDEVTRLRLNADLVVLSACQSGQGRMAAGEGLLSLGRAFLFAGCRGIVVSLWSVADQETSVLMADLYRHLQAGKLASDALREAQLAMLRAGKAPRYWAPFILIGE